MHHTPARASSVRPPRTRARLLILAAVVLALLVSVLTTTSAIPAFAGTPRPSIVLVHGAFSGPSAWDEVAAGLHKDGYTTVTPALTLSGLADDVATVRATLDATPGPKILVGHSYGGFVVSNAATASSTRTASPRSTRRTSEATSPRISTRGSPPRWPLRRPQPASASSSRRLGRQPGVTCPLGMPSRASTGSSTQPFSATWRHEPGRRSSPLTTPATRAASPTTQHDSSNSWNRPQPPADPQDERSLQGATHAVAVPSLAANTGPLEVEDKVGTLRYAYSGLDNVPQGFRGPRVAPDLRRRSARQGVRTGRRHESLGHPPLDMMEPLLERAGIEFDGCSE